MNTQSYSSFASSRNSRMVLEFRSSDGFGEVGPAVMMSSDSMVVLFTVNLRRASLQLHSPIKMSVRPVPCSMPRVRCTEGRCRSASTSRMRFPVWETDRARLAEVVVLPSWGRLEVIASILISSAGDE